MKRFTQLFQEIDATTSTNEKVQAIQNYFTEEEPANAVWALYLLLGKTRKRLITSRVLRDVFLSISDIPEWLFEDCYAHVGDSAEVISLLMQDTPIAEASGSDIALSTWMETILPQAKKVESEAELYQLVISWWSALTPFEVFILNKLLTGAFRVGASAKLVIKGLSAACGVSEPELAHRLMGDFEPTAAFYEHLIGHDQAQIVPSRPYPFFLASPLEEERFQTEDLSRWQAEWKWDGIRAQVIRRADEVFIWSRGEDLITPQFPEIATAFQTMPNGTVLDGEIVCWEGGSPESGTERPMSFNALQKRLGRKRVTQKVMDENPAHFIAYDMLEQNGQDIRDKTLSDRRQCLLSLLEQHSSTRITPSTVLTFNTWEDLKALRERSRDYDAEGLVLKALDSPYLVGRKRGSWWKFKVDPMTLDAVLIYAQAGSGKRANLFTDYTFALWKGDELVPFAKAYSGLDNAEIDALDRWIRKHTIEKFGPVRSVEPIHVFEIGFEGISLSKRHKSGIAVRFPRILRWRTDKPAQEADTVETAMTLLDNAVEEKLEQDNEQ
ncbi:MULTISPECIES: ATP-dependent DNA ligase [unclassified Leptolyngbya]|uniref:ATP-dependent DNA ligase n=1 Tax=unclassified Leptolyngbya TaxID=2650499 RepID=UPI0016899471|nr:MULTISPECIES: ATP-dependent DNA ligase [unclassified Leptolyngbya]MBD1913871.1 ATP-dependent DNA ligase [Leptolyngbya sp. FACHB-8]MBD2157381.1 ATP-dependent DNA ligase [Leptolyngbya sp. FACHB-16]